MPASDKRRLLYLKPTAAPDELVSAIHGAGWDVHLVPDAKRAREMIEAHEFRVGLAHCEVCDGCALQAPLQDLYPADRHMQWVALVSREAMAQAAMCDLIRERCYDFHTLPPDPERLLVTLGRAHGMAELGRRAGHCQDGALDEQEMIGRSPAMQTLYRMCARSAAWMRRCSSAARAAPARSSYYRLNVLHLGVPPLRERESDIELLARYFFDKFAAEKSPSVKGFSQQALQVMSSYAWPGNVRELINRVRRALVMGESRLIGAGDLGLERRSARRCVMTLVGARAAAEKEAIQCALRHARNNVSSAAQELRISRVTLYRLMDKYGIEN